MDGVCLTLAKNCENQQSHRTFWFIFCFNIIFHQHLLKFSLSLKLHKRQQLNTDKCKTECWLYELLKWTTYCQDYILAVGKIFFKPCLLSFWFFFCPYRNIITVALFYGLPVVQLVLTYQRVVDTSGDQDICYYNDFCQRPYRVLRYALSDYLFRGCYFHSI